MRVQPLDNLGPAIVDLVEEFWREPERHLLTLLNAGGYSVCVPRRLSQLEGPLAHSRGGLFFLESSKAVQW